MQVNSVNPSNFYTTSSLLDVQARINGMTVAQVMTMANNPDITPIQGRAIERAMESILRTVRANMTNEVLEPELDV